jgi:hypothetical protein
VKSEENEGEYERFRNQKKKKKLKMVGKLIAKQKHQSRFDSPRKSQNLEALSCISEVSEQLVVTVLRNSKQELTAKQLFRNLRMSDL